MKDTKKLYWIVKSNGDLSVTCPNFETIKDLIEGDLESSLQTDEASEIEYTLSPVYYTDEEYANLPEAEF